MIPIKVMDTIEIVSTDPSEMRILEIFTNMLIALKVDCNCIYKGNQAKYSMITLDYKWEQLEMKINEFKKAFESIGLIINQGLEWTDTETTNAF